ncbi:MAG: ribonuclease III [Candidatus Zixiibacteriota bacterium]
MSIWTQIRRVFSGSTRVSHTKDLAPLEDILGHRFHDRALLRQGLTHRSIIRVRNGLVPSNERLEFLGDSVLGLVIADQLFRDHPHMTEGDLTKVKAMLVNETALSRVAVEIGLNNYIMMSSEEEKSGGRDRASIISDAFEAVIGAIYLDAGIEAARRTIISCLYSRRDSIAADDSQRNFKGELLELIQAQGGGSPQYEVISEFGPDHDKTFSVAVRVGDQRLGEGTGPTKKEAEQRAAAMALEQLRRPDTR